MFTIAERVLPILATALVDVINDSAGDNFTASGVHVVNQFRGFAVGFSGSQPEQTSNLEPCP